MTASAPAGNFTGYMPQLDGLRGIAILIVLFAHLQQRLPSILPEAMELYGFMGVDLFFVISGFLITGILLDSVGSEHYFRNFYVRRILRIWPLYFALLTFVFLVLPTVFPGEREHIFDFCHPWESYLFFAQNFMVHKLGIMPLGVTWSLAVEEQFYLAWPLLILLLPRRLIPAFVIAVALLSPVVRGVAQAHGVRPEVIFRWTIYRLDSICAGALLAMWAGSKRFSRVVTSWIFVGLTAAGLVGCFITLSWLWYWPVCQSLGYSAVSIFFFGVVGWALLAEPHSLMYRGLSAAWLRYTGKLCFGLYLLHVAVFDALTPERLGLSGSGWSGSLAVMVVDLAAVFLMAGLSWKFFESPILRLKRWFEYGRGRKAGALNPA